MPNLTDPRLTNIKVRSAISYTINQGQVCSVGRVPATAPGQRDLIVAPTFFSTLDQSALWSWVVRL